MQDRLTFFKKLIDSGLFKSLTADQVASINTIIDCFQKQGYTDERWLSYILGTAKWETGQTMLPVEERNWGKKLYARLIEGHRYYGRGYVQITHPDNYRRLGNILNIPLLDQPELALQPPIAAKIAVVGSVEGYFTGVGLRKFFNSRTADWFNARKVINLLDNAEIIARYGKRFYECLN